MKLKIPVKDRISTYPGRVVLTPVDGGTNTFDMVRADVPLEEGTPINKTLFDSKADTVTEDVVLYVSTSGDNSNGDGSADAPYATIQAAIDSIPKALGGHTVTIDIASGTYDNKVSVVGFSGGKLMIGVYNRNVTIGSIEIVDCSNVETNISYIVQVADFTGTLYHARGGSNVLIGSAMQIDAFGNTATGISATDGSSVYSQINETISVSNCNGAAVSADKCSVVSLDTITGSENVVGMTAFRGGIISYKTNTMSNMWGNSANSGGLILTGENSSELSGATLDL